MRGPDAALRAHVADDADVEIDPALPERGHVLVALGEKADGDARGLGPQRVEEIDLVLLDDRYSPASELVEAWDQAYGTRRFEYDPTSQILANVPEHERAELFRYL